MNIPIAVRWWVTNSKLEIPTELNSGVTIPVALDHAKRLATTLNVTVSFVWMNGTKFYVAPEDIVDDLFNLYKMRWQEEHGIPWEESYRSEDL